jgi:hypothetical protein
MPHFPYRLTNLTRTPHLNGALCFAEQEVDLKKPDARVELTLSVGFQKLCIVRARCETLKPADLGPLIPSVPDFDKDAASCVMYHCDWYTLKELSRVSHFWRQCALRELTSWKGPRALVQNARGSFHILSVLMVLFPFPTWRRDDDDHHETAEWKATAGRVNQFMRVLAAADKLSLPYDTQPMLTEWSRIFPDANGANDANEFHMETEMIFRLPVSTKVGMVRTMEIADSQPEVHYDWTKCVDLPREAHPLGVTEYMDEMIRVGTINHFTGENRYMDVHGRRVDARSILKIGTLPELLRVHVGRFDFDFRTERVSHVTDFVSFDPTMTLASKTYALKALLAMKPHSTSIQYVYFVLGSDDIWYKIEENHTTALCWTQMYERTTYEEVQRQLALNLWYM